MTRDARSPTPHPRRRFSFIRAVILVAAVIGALQLCRELASPLIPPPVDKVCNCTLTCPINKSTLADHVDETVVTNKVELPPPSPCPVLPPPSPSTKDTQDDESNLSAINLAAGNDNDYEEDESGDCRMQPLVHRASEEYNFEELTTFLNHTEILFAGVSPGSKYSFSTTKSNMKAGWPLKSVGFLEMQHGFPTAAMSEAVALHASYPTKLCLLKAWLNSWGVHPQNKKIRAVIHPSLFENLGQPSFLYPQGFYFSGAKSTGPLLYERYRGIDPERPMAFRSQSKALASATIMALQDKGLLNIDAKIGKYLQEYTGDFTNVLTIRMVLSHTSGADRYGADNKPSSKDPLSLRLHNISLAESARIIARDDISHQPGEFLYTAIAYQILGAIAEKVTGKSWHKVFKEYIAEPIGMTNTQWYSFYSNEYPVANPLLAVGAVGSPRDFERFTRMLMNMGKAERPDGSSVKVLSRKAVLDMTTINEVSTGGISRAFGLLNAGNIRQIQAMGFISETTNSMSIGAWETTVGYGLGLWIVTRNDSSSKIIHLAGMYNSHAIIYDFGSQDAVFSQGFAFTKFDGTWTVPATMFYKAMHGIVDPPPSKHDRNQMVEIEEERSPVLDLQQVFDPAFSSPSPSPAGGTGKESGGRKKVVKKKKAVAADVIEDLTSP